MGFNSYLHFADFWRPNIGPGSNTAFGYMGGLVESQRDGFDPSRCRSSGAPPIAFHPGSPSGDCRA